MEKISAVVQTYNASEHLAAVLEHLRGFDEIFVVDMESTDDTVEIARRHGARVDVVPRGEHRIVEAYRQYAIDHAKHPWVFIVDADEIVPKALRDYLYAEIERDSTPRGLLIPIKNYFMGRWMRCYYPNYILRFFYRDIAKWPYVIHTKPVIDGPVMRIPKKRDDLAFIHLQTGTYGQYLDKLNVYTSQEVERRRGKFKTFKFFVDPFFRFFKAYVLKGGFRCGMPGLIHCVLDAFYKFSYLSKLEEEKLAQQTDNDLRRDLARSGD